MADDLARTLRSRRILIAEELRYALEDLGAQVTGPVATVHDTLEFLHSQGRLDGETLDLSLGREKSHDVAYALRARRVPFVILSGYDERGLPEGLRRVPRCERGPDRVVRRDDRLLAPCTLTIGSGQFYRDFLREAVPRCAV